jgi:NAD(P)H dehydrogenase (quinone)
MLVQSLCRAFQRSSRVSMSFVDEQLLVTGASGNLGKAVVVELRRLGATNVIAATRTPGKHSELAALGVEEREADFDRPETLQKAFRDVKRLLLISTDSLHASDVRIKQHRDAIAAAVRAGVEHVIYTSIPNAHPTEGPSIPDDHFWTEVALFESGRDWTILRNNLYAEVILRSAQSAIKTGKMVSATRSQGRSYVTRDDCARAAAAALLTLTGKTIFDVTGPASVTQEEIASILSRLSGKSIQHVNVTPDEVEKALVAIGIPQFAARSVRELDEETSRGYYAIVVPTVTNLTGRDPTSVEDFLQTTVPALIA